MTEYSNVSIPGITIPDVVSGYAYRTPDAEAVVCGDRRLTWSEFVDAYHRSANALIRAGLNKGDKVCLLMVNSVEMVVMMMATLKAGGVLVPLSPLFDSDTLARMMARVEANFLFASADHVSKVASMPESGGKLRKRTDVVVGGDASGWLSYDEFIAQSPSVDPGVTLLLDDDFNVMFTSGTTGDPKGAVHSHLARLLYPLGVGVELGIHRDATALLATPLYHNGTWLTMLPTLHHGGKIVILPKFDAAQFLNLVQQERCTHSFLVPSQLIVLMELSGFATYDTRSLGVILTGGSPLSPTTFDAVRERFAHSDLLEIYGMSEGFCTFVGPKDYAQGKGGSVGRAAHFVNTDVKLIGPDDQEVGIGEIGEVVGTSAWLMKGYYNDAERTAETLWRDDKGVDYLRSGDLGRIDKEGYLSIVGRSKDMIISGGVNVFPVDVEDIFMQHPEVREVAVIGVPHPKWGETPLLLVLLRDGASVSEATLMAWGNERLGAYQRVSRVEFRDSFPRNSLDKIMKRELREPYWAGRDSELV
jgi:long-chain acyl-CoA synthetase